LTAMSDEVSVNNFKISRAVSNDGFYCKFTELSDC
jgi:hypothetical protein